MPGAHYQARPSPIGARRLSFHPDVITDRATLENVVPPADIQGWQVDLLVCLLDTDSAPVIVIVRMSQPVEEIRRTNLKHGEFAQGQMLGRLAHRVDRTHYGRQLLTRAGILFPFTHQPPEAKGRHHPAHVEE